MKIKNFRRLSTVFFALILVFVLSIGTAGTSFAGALINVDVTGDYELTSSDMRLHVSGTARIYTGDHSIAFINVAIDCAAGTQLTLEDVNIDNTPVTSVCPLEFAGAGNTLTLTGINTLTGTYSEIDIPGEPGIKVEGSAAVTIDGAGELYATGFDGGAGIGGGYEQALGTITINGGTINAYGGANAAGIGGGADSTGGTININGGHITATTNEDGAAIGGGQGCTGGTINITGGHITATANEYGAGIGCGNRGQGVVINISGGIIDATGDDHGAGIGGGNEESAGFTSPTSTINISGGTITALGGSMAAGIGGGFYGSADINITGADSITATGGDSGAGIGGGQYASGGTISISGGNIVAQGSFKGAGIGYGHYGGNDGVKVMAINISGGDIEATGGYYGGGIGYGHDCYDGTMTINISGGKIYAVSIRNGAGIGSGGGSEGFGSANSTVNISGGWIEAYGAYDSAGIGGSNWTDWGTVNLSGGVINADADVDDDIGSGDNSTIVGGVNISDSAVVFSLSNEIFGSTNLIAHSKAQLALYEASILLLKDTDVVLESAGGLYAPTWIGYDDNTYLDRVFSYLPDGTYFFSKDDGAMRTQNFEMDGADVTTDLEFVSVLLGDLAISEGALAPVFNSTTFEYGVDVGAGIESVNVTPTLLESSDDVTVNGVPVDNGTPSGEIALSVGTNVIEITVSDEEFPQTSNTYTVTVIRAGEPIEKGIGISGTLYDEFGNPLTGWTLVLESDPVTVVTDGAGQYSFADVSVENHTLTIKDAGGSVIKTYSIKLSEGDTFSYLVVNSTIFIVLAPQTVGVEIEFEIDGRDDTRILAINEIVGNPRTGDITNYTWLWAMLAAIALLIGAVFVRKAVKTK